MNRTLASGCALLLFACGQDPGGPAPGPDEVPDSIAAWVDLPGPPEAMAASPSGDRLYLACGTAGILYVETAGLTAGPTTVPLEANDIAVSPSGEHLFATRRASTEIVVIATSTMTVETTIPSPGFDPGSICTTADGVWALASLPNSGWLAILDAQEMQLDTAVRLPGQGAALAVCSNPYASSAYAVRGEEIGLVDLVAQAATDSAYCPGAGDLNTLCCSPDGETLVAALPGSHCASRLDAATLETTGAVELEGSPCAVSISADGTYAAFACAHPEYGYPFGIRFVDMDGFDLFLIVATPDIPKDLAWSQDGTRLYAACTDGGGPGGADRLVVLE